MRYMNTEIEVKFLQMNHDNVRAKLRELGAVCEQPMRLMRRVTFDSPVMKAKNGWIRVRDEGNRVTMGYKQTDSLTIDGVKEIETTVGDFDTAVAILKQLEMDGGSFQESKRESWRLGEVQIELDEWPWLEPYIEIEAPTQEQIYETAGSLGMDIAKAVSGDVMSAYRDQYPNLLPGNLISDLPEVKFGAPLPEMFTSQGYGHTL